MSKIKVWVDTETTGLDPRVDQIHQLSAYLPEGNKMFDVFIRYDRNVVAEDFPFVIPEVEERIDPITAFRWFKEFLRQIKHEYSPDEPLQFSGKNVSFDLGFLNEHIMWKRIKEEFFNYEPFDLDSVLTYLRDIGFFTRDQSLKLENVVKLFPDIAVKHTPHDGLSDAIVSAEIYQRLIDLTNNDTNIMSLEEMQTLSWDN